MEHLGIPDAMKVNSREADLSGIADGKDEKGSGRRLPDVSGIQAGADSMEYQA